MKADTEHAARLVYLYYSVNLMLTLLQEIPFLPRARCQTNTTTIQTSQLQALKTAQTQHPRLIIFQLGLFNRVLLQAIKDLRARDVTKGGALYLCPDGSKV